MSTSNRRDTEKTKKVISLLYDDDDVIDVNSPVYSSTGGKKRKRSDHKNDKSTMNTNNNHVQGSIISIVDDNDYDDIVQKLSPKKPPVSNEVMVVEMKMKNPTTTQRKRQEMTLKERILELYPDMDDTYLENSLLSRFWVSNHRHRDDDMSRILQQIVTYVKNDYPKKQKYVDDCDFENPSSSFIISDLYRQECPLALSQQFPFLSINGIHSILRKHQHRFTLSANYILTKSELLSSSSHSNKKNEDIEFQFQKLRNALSGRRCPKVSSDNPLSSFILSKCRRMTETKVFEEVKLQKEIQFIQRKIDDWKQTMKQKLERKKAREKSEKEGTLMECQCCFTEVAFEELLSCVEEGHLFCVDCIVRYLEHQIYTQQTSHLTCLHTSSNNCQSAFSYAQLQQQLPPKLLQAYDQLQTTQAIQTAIPQLESSICICPQCNKPTLIPTTQQILTCSHCQHESCRHCKKLPHIPLTCEEVVQDRQSTNDRTTVEEAMSQALIRSCPKCSTKFVKENGCNKMKCPKCGIFVCYICQKQIPKHIGYSHFCQTPHCSHKTCKKCCLYDNEDMQRQSIRQAGLHAAQQQTNSAANIDVDALLKRPRVNFHHRQR